MSKCKLTKMNMNTPPTYLINAYVPFVCFLDTDESSPENLERLFRVEWGTSNAGK